VLCPRVENRLRRFFALLGVSYFTTAAISLASCSSRVLTLLPLPGSQPAPVTITPALTSSSKSVRMNT
jgi:hypothetical protein